MSDDVTTGQKPEPGNGQEPTTPQNDQQQDTFTRDYVEKLRAEAAENRVKLKEFQEMQANAEEERLAKKQEWQELAEKRKQEIEALRPFQEKYQAMLDATAARNKERIEAIPEEMRSLVPEYDDPAKLGQWLDANWDRLNAKPLVPSLNGGAGSNNTRGKQVTLTDAQLTTAKKMGLTAEQYLAALPK